MRRTEAPPRWHRRARHALNHSLRVRLVALFLLLALGVTLAFLGGMQKALGVGWRDAARPLVADYIDRLAVEIGSPPSIERARALTERLPVSVRISGPQVNWSSGAGVGHDPGWDSRDGPRDRPLLQRTTLDGHRIHFGLNLAPLQNQPRRIGWFTLAVLLGLTALAYAYVRRMLRPLDDIRIGAARLRGGDFGTPIPVRRKDELGELAGDVNAMANSIHQMLEAKRGLLLAISHELRSPLTRARVNTELLPETPDVQAQRQALLHDLAQMRDLVTDLLESERLGQGHAALHLEPTELGALAREVVAQLASSTGPPAVRLDIASDLPSMAVDRSRLKLLLRNLLENALRHGADVGQPPALSLQREGTGIGFTVRDYGPGVDDAALPHLAEPFYRPDASRARETGGVGLGLFLCKLVALAHGGSFEIRNAHPGLEVRVFIPAA
jgi:signal transduction histidine kinase